MSFDSLSATVSAYHPQRGPFSHTPNSQIKVLTAGYYRGRSYLSLREIFLRIKEKNGLFYFNVTQRNAFSHDTITISTAVNKAIIKKIEKAVLSSRDRFQISTKQTPEHDIRLNIHILNGTINSLSIRYSTPTSTHEIIGLRFKKISAIGKAKYRASQDSTVFNSIRPIAYFQIFLIICVAAIILRIISEMLSVETIRTTVCPRACPVLDTVNGFSYKINNDYFYRIHVNDNILTVYYKNSLIHRSGKKASFDKILYHDLIEHKKKNKTHLEMRNIRPSDPEHDKLHTPFDLNVNHYHMQINGLFVVTPEVLEFFVNGLYAAHLIDKKTCELIVADFNNSFFTFSAS